MARWSITTFAKVMIFALGELMAVQKQTIVFTSRKKHVKLITFVKTFSAMVRFCVISFSYFTDCRYVLRPRENIFSVRTSQPYYLYSAILSIHIYYYPYYLYSANLLKLCSSEDES